MALQYLIFHQRYKSNELISEVKTLILSIHFLSQRASIGSIQFQQTFDEWNSHYIVNLIYMDYRERVFMAVAEHLSFSNAATSLFISQPAVTKHVKELEQKIGIALFVRQGNHVFLTKAGTLLYEHLQKISQLYSDLDDEIGSLKGESEGTLRLGASSTIVQYVLPKILADFQRRHPKLQVSLVSGNSLAMERLLLNREIDVALVENGSGNVALHYLPFAEDRIVAVAGTNSVYGKKGRLSIQDLHAVPLVLRESGSGTLQTVLQAFKQMGIDVEQLNVLIHLDATEAIKHYLRYTDGVAFVSERAIVQELQWNLLKKIEIKNVAVKRFFRIAQSPEPAFNEQQKFIDFLQNYNV